MGQFQFNLPHLGENIKAGDVVRILTKAGESVKKDESVIELETDKAVVEVPSPVAGVVKEVHVKEGAKAAVGQLILTIETEGEAPAPQKAAKKAEEKSAPSVEKKPSPEKVPAAKPAAAPASPLPPDDNAASRAAPSIRKLARELNVDLSQVSASGPGGRITAEDVKNFREKGGAEPATAPPGVAQAHPQLPDFAKWGETERKPMSSVRRSTAASMAVAWAIPHVTQFDNADITEVMALRKRYAKRVEAAGGNLTITAILLKVIASALKVFPQFNASLDLKKEEIIYKKYCHIGVAVDTERGLLVPVIRDVDKKNILEISVALNQASQRAKDKKTTLDEMAGSSFTLTNLGSIGGTHFTPIIHHPEVAILGVGRGSEQPVFKDGTWVPRLILPLSLSYDHRLIDGADAARFLRWLADAVQEPFLMDLEG